MTTRRIVSWIAAFALVLGLCPASSFADELEAAQAPAEMKATAVVSSAKSRLPGQLTVKLAGDAAEYEVQVATTRRFSANRVSMVALARTATFKKLAKGKTYYVRARAKATADDSWGEWSRTRSARVQNDGAWKMSNGYATYLKPNGKLARGLSTIGGKTYLFTGEGRQKTGWQRYKGAYRFFGTGVKARGAMATGRVVNGIKLAKSGEALYSAAGLEELKLMVKAQKLAEQLNKPAESKAVKLRRGFNWMRYDCVERGLHEFGSYEGWHRTFARDILFQHTGSCFSYGAAMAYYANAIGYKSCRVVSSGGHGWAEIDGKVYDVEWSRVTGNTYFAFPYARSGSGAPNYASARSYVVQIAPKTRPWK